MIVVEICNQQDVCPVDETRLSAAVQQVLAEAGIRRGEISVAVVDDEQMQTLNRQYLAHDYTTDVLSFQHERDADSLTGELILCGPVAARACEEYGWRAADELLLYAVHGSLHLVGYDDATELDRQRMRAAEQRHLTQLGCQPLEGATTR